MAIYGCDVGNGFGFLSLVPAEGEEAQPVLTDSPDLNASEGMPTAAYITPPSGTPILVYDAVKGSARLPIRRDPAHGVRAVKTRLWEEAFNLPGLNRSISPYDVYGAIVRDLVRLGNVTRLQEKRSPIYELVFTYPAAIANSDHGLAVLDRMQESIEAVVVDGHPLKVAARLPEPAAAAIDYLYFLQYQAPEKQRRSEESFTVLVYDLGHGTFDTAAVTARSKGEPYHVWASDGLPDVGGRNFDDRLLEELIGMLDRDYHYQLQNAQDREDLLQEAIAAKHALSKHAETVFQHQNHQDGTYMDLSITRERFEELTQDLLLQTLEKTQEMVSEQLAKGRTFDAVVLSGGASQMPMVQAALEAHLQPHLPVYLFRPHKAVSFGAARYALGVREKKPQSKFDPKPHPEPNPVAQLYTQHAYGVLVEEPGNLEGEIRVLLSEGTPLPAQAEVLDFPVYEGRSAVRIYRPPANLQGLASTPEVCVNLVWLHFDTPRTERCKLTLTVDSNYNIAVTLQQSDGTAQTRSTADNRTSGRT